MKTIFIGTSEFARIILEKMIQNKYLPVLVVTAPDKPVGRKKIITPSPVKILAKKHNIKIIQPTKIKDCYLEIKNLKPELGILASFGKIIPLEILNIPKYNFINIHPSLLPKYRGPSPIQTAILNGDQETGITIIKMTEKIDDGPIISSKKLKIKEKSTYQELHNQLAVLGAELLVKIIPDWISQKIKLKKQSKTKLSYTQILKKQDGKINWNKPAQKIENQIRAFYPWPGSYSIWPKQKNQEIKIKILKAEVSRLSNEKKYPAGKVLIINQNKIIICCGKDYLEIKKLQIEGKKETTPQDFLRGYNSFTKTTFK